MSSVRFAASVGSLALLVATAAASCATGVNADPVESGGAGGTAGSGGKAGTGGTASDAGGDAAKDAKVDAPKDAAKDGTGGTGGTVGDAGCTAMQKNCNGFCIDPDPTFGCLDPTPCDQACPDAPLNATTTCNATSGLCDYECKLPYLKPDGGAADGGLACEPPPPPPSCCDDSDCTGGLLCDGGTCKLNALSDPYCGNAECAAFCDYQQGYACGSHPGEAGVGEAGAGRGGTCVLQIFIWQCTCN